MLFHALSLRQMLLCALSLHQMGIEWCGRVPHVSFCVEVALEVAQEEEGLSESRQPHQAAVGGRGLGQISRGATAVAIHDDEGGLFG